MIVSCWNSELNELINTKKVLLNQINGIKKIECFPHQNIQLLQSPIFAFFPWIWPILHHGNTWLGYTMKRRQKWKKFLFSLYIFQYCPVYQLFVELRSYITRSQKREWEPDPISVSRDKWASILVLDSLEDIFL